LAGYEAGDRQGSDWALGESAGRRRRTRGSRASFASAVARGEPYLEMGLRSRHPCTWLMGVLELTASLADGTHD
jgi:hypothetical protein